MTAPALDRSTAREPNPAIDRLSRASVDQRTDAYADVDWASVGSPLDVTDPRWELPIGIEPLAATAWYQGLPQAERARLGIERSAGMLKVGWQFENLLQRGLLQRSLVLPDDHPQLRYLQHEVAEEAQHTLMFQELIRRVPAPVGGVPRAYLVWTERLILRMAVTKPALFFIFVMGGEDPADCLQRRLLRSGQGHPLFQQIVKIHVAEEARHLSFARGYLTDKAPHFTWWQRQRVAFAIPLVMAFMARMMLYPSPEYVERNQIPKDVLIEAYASPAGRALLRDMVAKPRQLARDLGLVTRFSERLWRRYLIWE
jgi:hypothetical protein